MFSKKMQAMPGAVQLTTHMGLTYWNRMPNNATGADGVKIAVYRKGRASLF